MQRVLAILVSGILILPGVVNAGATLEILKLTLKFDKLLAVDGNLTRTASLKKVEANWLRYAEEIPLTNPNISGNDQSYLTAVTLDRNFIDEFFGPEVSDALADRVPDLKLLWQSAQDLPLAELHQRYPNLYPTVPLELYRRDPKNYWRLLAMNRTSNSLTLDDLTKHLQSLLTQQLEQDLSKLVTSATLNPTTYRRTNIRGSLHEFLSSAKVKEETRRQEVAPLDWTECSVPEVAPRGVLPTRR